MEGVKPVPPTFAPGFPGGFIRVYKWSTLGILRVLRIGAPGFPEGLSGFSGLFLGVNSSLNPETRKARPGLTLNNWEKKPGKGSPCRGGFISGFSKRASFWGEEHGENGLFWPLAWPACDHHEKFTEDMKMRMAGATPLPGFE